MMKVFGRYALLQQIKSGGMGSVWRARDLRNLAAKRDVAIKTIVTHAAHDPAFVQMFVDEAKITVQLTNASIGQVYELGVVDDTWYFAMEYVSGQDLRSVFERSRSRAYPMPIPMACYVISRVAEALDYAHSKTDRQGRPLGVIHRDVSPHNVLVSYEGEVKLIDFGIARVAATHEAPDVIKGKLAYMSPEQVRARPLDGRSDLFSAGLVLHELLTGARAFEGTDFSVLEKVRTADLPPPSRLNPRVPPELDAIVARAVARDREARFPDASEFAQALQRFCFPTGRNELARFMQSMFSEELAAERRRLSSPEPLPSDADLAHEHGHTTVLVSCESAPAERPGMALVPAADDEPAFLVDLAPVTVGDYAEFLMSTGATLPPQWVGLETEQLAAPAVGISHAGAQAFATWSGRRLLSLWEWRRASRALPRAHFGRRWEWTSSPSPKGGHFVCGGPHRDVPGAIADAEHVSFELGAGRDVAFRCAADVP